MRFFVTILIVLGSAHLLAEPIQPFSQLRHTYSIVALDPVTGELGGGAQSHWFNVSVGLLWAEPGVGAVVSQSFLDPAYGAEGIKHMRQGKAPQQILDHLVAQDEGRDLRQLAMIDAQGRVANFTGKNAISEHCEISGDNYSVQANLMWKPGVCQAMSKAFESTSGDLAGKIMAALDAAEAAGGDIRGRQSAALLVLDGQKGTPDYKAQKFNLRVDDSPRPLGELRRLLSVARAYRLMEAADEYLAAGDMKGALKSYREAMAAAPDNHEILFWTAVTLANEGSMEEAEPLFARAFELWPRWRELVPRLPKSELLLDDKELIQRILQL